jgi:acetyl esterase/lipase
LQDCKRAVRWVKQHAHEYGADVKRHALVVGGESAGGHLAMLLALTSHGSISQAEREVLQPGFAHVDCSVDACIDLYGVHDFTDVTGVFARKSNGQFHKFISKTVMRKRIAQHPDAFYRASPVHRVGVRGVEKQQHKALLSAAALHSVQTRWVPPHMTAHGDLDTLVPIEDARLFHACLKRRRLAEKQPPCVADVFVELPGAHHAFNYVISPRSLALGDAATDFCRHVNANVARLRLQRDVANAHAAPAL